MEVPWWKSRVFWGTVFAAVPQLVHEITTAAGDISKILAAIVKFGGIVLAAVGVRGAILRAGGIKG